MGCVPSADPRCFPFEQPQHPIELAGFEIARTEVSRAEYAECLDSGSCGLPNCEWNPEEAPDLPVVCVSWHQAEAYCRFRDQRLCSEAEWERAARGSDARIYPWGDQTPDCQLAVVDQDGPGCGNGGPGPVGSRPDGVSPPGAHDMAGNVFEWVADWYGAGYYSESPPADPPGPEAGTARVIRGGSFNSDALTTRTSYRASANPEFGYYDLGMRCCR